jgi:ribosomal protein S18 acetylase RimI-like enzyme
MQPSYLTLSPSVWVVSLDDAETVAELLAELRDWRQQARPDDATLRSRTALLLEGGDAEFLLARTENWAEPSGLCQLRFHETVWSAEPQCHIEDLYVRSHARGCGVGRALLEAAINRARMRGCAHIDSDVDETNERAVRLYERAGFGSKYGPGHHLLVRLYLG